MTIEHYLLSLRLTDQVSWRAMWLGMIHYGPRAPITTLMAS